MPAWWQELKEVPSQDNLQEFRRRMWASFQGSKVTLHSVRSKRQVSLRQKGKTEKYMSEMKEMMQAITQAAIKAAKQQSKI